MGSNSNEPDAAFSVLALVPYPPGLVPSQRYRIEQWIPCLAEQGIRVDLSPFADPEMMRRLHEPGQHAAKAASLVGAIARRVATVVRSRRYDVVVVHRAACLAGPATLERIIAWSGGRLVLDFDDAIFLLHTTRANSGFGWLKFPRKTDALCRISSQVVVGNDFLARYARERSQNVTIVPSSVDTDRYHPHARPRTERVVLGWMGSSTSQTHLEMFASVLKQLSALPDVRLKVVSDRRPDLPGIQLEWKAWSAESEIDDLASFDIGIMPMPDDEWSKGKSSFKALLYMAMGVPVIASPVGTNAEIVRHGINGFLASSEDEWTDYTSKLASDSKLRMIMGQAGRQTVEDGFSIRRSANLFAQVLRAAARGDRRRAAEPSSGEAGPAEGRLG